MEKLVLPSEVFVSLGRCFKSHGLKGGIILQLFNRDETTLKKGVEVQVYPLNEKSSLPKDGRVLRLRTLSIGPKVIGHFHEIDDKSQAEALLPFEIGIRRKNLPPTKEASKENPTEEFYLVDLLKLPVFDHLSGQELGYIRDFYDNKAQIVFIIQGPQGNTFEIPFTRNFFPLVDIPAKRVEIYFPEYID